ncbi:hypothetical protein, partial [Roseibacillus persicicus]|uniref:hypothetical protein n=1 Tax=Roseibacillus persicicus TaxID=454148 RepID=UPI00280E4C1F
MHPLKSNPPQNPRPISSINEPTLNSPHQEGAISAKPRPTDSDTPVGQALPKLTPVIFGLALAS